MSALVTPVLIATAIAAALVGGILFAFSTFVMRALARQAPASGIATMQAINATVFTPWVMVPFVGTGLALIAMAILLWSGAVPGPRTAVAVAASLYAVGCLGITGSRNVPMNERLDGFAPGSAEGAAYWVEYVRRWNRWNHARTAACLGTALVLVTALGG